MYRGWSFRLHCETAGYRPAAVDVARLAVRQQSSSRMSDEVTTNNLEELEIELLLEAVFRHYGYDLRDYDRGVVRLRIRERMLAGRIPTISRFQEKVLREPALLERLLGALSPRDLLMFSDPAFYHSFRTKVFPQLRTYPFVRIWHA